MEKDHSITIGPVKDKEVPLPAWLSCPEPSSPRLPIESRKRLDVEYNQIFERVIEGVYAGKSLYSSVKDDPRIISYESFMNWIKRDPVRHNRFKEAQEMRTEFMVGEIIEISDGLDSIDPSAPDVINRDKMRIDTRKWVMGAHNRKRYGETKQIEVAGSISINDALAAGRSRLIENEIIDVEPGGS